ncbi:MAG: hypothetical protein ACXVZV_01220 [Terriglobales bacterium]
MMLEVSEQEHQLIIDLLELRLRALRLEIIHTDIRAFKHSLEERERELEQLRNRLAAPVHA